MAFPLKILAALALLVGVDAATAGSLQVMVQEDAATPINEVVVIIRPLSPGLKPEVVPEQITIDQVDKEFIGKISIVTAGSTIQFPNHDNIRHHVYSFSPAKQFELPLYRGTPAEPVLFDKPGVVKLGCNIHDWMIAYIYVADTPYTTMTAADGAAVIDNLPEGDYEVRLWHARMITPEEATARRFSINAAEASHELQWRISLKPDMRPHRAPMRIRSGY